MVNPKEGLKLSRLGLGCGRMSNSTGAADRMDAIATIHSALDAGVIFLDTADFYTSGHNEMLIGEALKGSKRDKAFLSVKFGALVAPDGVMYGLDVRPFAIKNFLTYSLKRLNVDYIDLYQPARIDLAIPVEETIGAVAIQSLDVNLSESDIKRIEEAVPEHAIAGGNFPGLKFNNGMVVR